MSSWRCWSAAPCGGTSWPSSTSRPFSRGGGGGGGPTPGGRGGRIRTVAIPIWVKKGIDVWRTAAEIEQGRLLRSVSKSGKLNRDTLSDWAVWSIVEQSSKQIGIEHFGAHDLRRTCAKLCRKNGGGLEQIKFLLGHSSLQTTGRRLGGQPVVPRPG